MSLFQTFTSLLSPTPDAGQPTPEQHASIAQALLQHAGQQPGGLTGILDQFRQNGLGQHADSWLRAQPATQPAQSLQPQQVEQGLGAEAIQSIAQRAGLSPEMAKIALATALPLLISHLSRGSGQLPAQAGSGSGLAGLAESLFSRAL
jgi:uncharacterized protein YidB (DUF937 family)